MSELDPVVVFLAVDDGRAERLLAEHIDDGRGHCTSCTVGAQAGRAYWWCTLATLAAAARERGSTPTR